MGILLGMMVMVGCIGITAAWLGLFYIWGKTLLTLFRLRSYFSNSVLFGLVSMSAVFQLFYLPFFFTRGSYHSLMILWSILLVGITGAMLIYLRRHEKKHRKAPLTKGQVIAAAAAIAVTLFLCAIAAYHPRSYGYDTNYYISIVNDMIYRDVICITDGALDVHHGLTNLFAMLGMASWLTGISPFYLEMHSMRYFGVILTALAACNAGRCLFHEENSRISIAGSAMAILVPIIFSFWGSMYGGAFFWQRTNEAKAICQLALFPLAFTVIIQLFQNHDERKKRWWEQAVIGLSAVPISVSSIFVYPALILIGMIGLLAHDRFRNFRSSVGYSVLCVLPNLIYLVVYYASKYWVAL